VRQDGAGLVEGADALEIEAMASKRLADEYDAAQERGEAVGRKGGGDSTVPERNAATAADLGLTRKQIHEARVAALAAGCFRSEYFFPNCFSQK
jgi:hypothetical protein